MRRLAFLSLLIPVASFSALASVDTGLLALVPSGAKTIAGVDLDRARSSDFGQYMVEKINTTDRDFEQFVTETGFDPRRDIDQLLFTATGPNTSGGESHFAILARGSFDQDRVQSVALTKGLSSQPFEGVTLFVQTHRTSDSEVAFAFLGDGVAVMGDPGTVKTIISSRATPAVLDPAMQAQIARVGGQYDAWFVSFVPGQHWASHFNPQAGASGSTFPMPRTQALESVLQASGGLRFASTVDLSFDAITRSPQDATSLADVVRFFTSMMQMARDKGPHAAIAASAFDNMNLSTDGDTMHLSLSLPEKSFEQLLDSAPGDHTHSRAPAMHPQAQ